MLRRILAFVIFIALIAGVSTLVYFNAQETSFRITPDRELTLPLGMLMLGAVVAGALVMFVFALMREGRHALREWRVHRELRAVERAAEYRTRARSLALGGDFKQARSLLNKAIHKRTPQVSDIVDYAETYLLEDNAAESRRVLEEGQKDVGNDPLLLYTLARACQASDDTAAALSALERALRVYPASLPLLSMLRDLLFESGAWQRAAEIQERIVALKPGDAREQNRLAGARFEAARRVDPEQRTAALRAVVTAQPNFLPAVIEHARALHTVGEARRALKSLERTARHNLHPALFNELERLASENNRQRVIKLYTKLVSSHPSDAQLRLRAARYFLACERSDEAEQILRALSDGNDMPQVAALRARIFEARGDTDAAREAYRKSLACCDALAPALACTLCRAPAAGWHERCAQCGAWGTLQPT